MNPQPGQTEDQAPQHSEPFAAGQPAASTDRPANSNIRKLKRITALTLIVAGIFFAIVSILAIWGVLGDSDFIARALGTLGVIAFVALILNVGSRLMEDRHK